MRLLLQEILDFQLQNIFKNSLASLKVLLFPRFFKSFKKT